jgi:hypothetical protein
MVGDIGLAGKFSNIGALDDMSWSSIVWWHPSAKAFIKALKKGAIL